MGAFVNGASMSYNVALNVHGTDTLLFTELDSFDRDIVISNHHLKDIDLR